MSAGEAPPAIPEMHAENVVPMQGSAPRAAPRRSSNVSTGSAASAAKKSGVVERLVQSLRESPWDRDLPPDLAELLHELLSAAGATKGIQSDHDFGNGNTLLHLCAIAGEVGPLKEALVLGARVDAVNGNGGTPLHVAACVSWRACEVLLDAGALMSARDKQGRTALQRAQSNDRRDLDETARLEMDRIVAGMTARVQRTTARLSGADRTLEDAQRGGWRVCRVEWYDLPVSGWGGTLGRKHALLKIETERIRNDGSQEHRDFVIEKAATLRNVSNGSFAKNGIFVTLWPQVSTVPGLSRTRVLLPEEVREGEMGPLLLVELYEAATDATPRNPGPSTSAQLAAKLWNLCAVEGKSVSGGGSDAMGVMYGMASTGLSEPSFETLLPAGSDARSDFFSAKMPFGLERSERQPSRGALDVAVDAALLSDFIYRPTRRIPDQDGRGSSVLRFPLRNRLTQEVQVYIEETEQRFNLTPGATDYPEIPFFPGEDRAVIVVYVNTLSVLGLTLPRTRLCRQLVVCENRGDEAYDIDTVETLTGKKEVTFNRRSPLPDHLEIHPEGVHFSDSVELLVQWARVDTKRPAGGANGRRGREGEAPEGDGRRVTYVVFCGLDNGVDAMIHEELVRDDVPFRDFGLEVHASLWAALNQNGTESVLGKVQAVAEEVREQRGKIVLCGHALGGCYAVLAGLHLLAMPDLDGLDLEVASFGAPQVIAIKQRNEAELPGLWRKLHERTTQYINAWDPMVRLPSSYAWVHWTSERVAALPRNSSEPGIDPLRRYVDRIKGFGEHPRVYDSIGTLAFMCKELDYMQMVETDPVYMRHRGVLDALPQNNTTAPTLVEYHSRVQYWRTLQKIRAQTSANPSPPSLSPVAGDVDDLGNGRQPRRVSVEPRDWGLPGRLL